METYFEVKERRVITNRINPLYKVVLIKDINAANEVFYTFVVNEGALALLTLTTRTNSGALELAEELGKDITKLAQFGREEIYENSRR